MDEAKQLIKIINRVRFMIENNLGLLRKNIIFDLAIIMRAAIMILKIISVDAIVSIAENDEIE